MTPSTWNFPTQATTTYTYAGSLSKLSTALATRSGATGTTNPTYRGIVRYVIGPLAAQTIAGTVKGQLRCFESNTGANATLATAIKIVQPDGSDRAVLLAYTAADTFTDNTAPEFATALRNASIRNTAESAAPALTSQAASAGDYLVIELGWRSATGTSRTVNLRVGDTGATDLAENETDATNDYVPWVEFSGDLQWVTTKSSADDGALVLSETASFPVLPYAQTDTIPLALADVGASFRFVLYQGVTPIATQTVALSAAYQDFTFALSAGEKALITDPLTLRFGYVATGARVRVSWSALATPSSTSIAKGPFADTLSLGSSEWAAGGPGTPQQSADAGAVAMTEGWDLVADMPVEGLQDRSIVALAEVGTASPDTDAATKSAADTAGVTLVERAVVADSYVVATVTLIDRTTLALAEASTLATAYVDRLACVLTERATGTALITTRDAIVATVTDGIGFPYTAARTDALGVTIAETYLKTVLGTQSAVFVNGVNRTAYVGLTGGVRITYSLNERGQANVTFLPGYMPDRLDDIAVYAEDGITQLFGGFVLQRRVEGVHPQSLESLTVCECVDYSVLLDWYYVSATYVADVTLHTVLTDLVAALPADYGLSLDGTNYTGTVLSAFTWTTMRASDALRELSSRTGRAWGVSRLRVISLAALPAGVGPQSYTEAGTTPYELAWNDPTEVPANAVILSCGPSGTAISNQAWTANGIASSWVADIAAAGPGSYWLVSFSPPWNGALYGTVGVGAMFSWDWMTRTLTSNIGAPPAGTVVTFPYLALYPFSVSANTGESPQIQLLARDETITEYARGVEMADGLLARIAGHPRELTFRSKTHGWRPGQSVSIDLDGRAFSATAIVRSVEVSYGEDLAWWYVITATESSVYGGSYLDEWRAITGGSSSGVVLISSGAPTDSPAAIPPLNLYLGGSQAEYHIGTSGGDWFNVPNAPYYFVVGEYYADKHPQVRARIWGDDATALTLRLFDLTTATSVGSGSNGSATAVEIEFDVTLATGRHEYVLQMQPGNGKSGWCAYGVLETLG